MGVIEWGPEYSVGVDKFDQEHLHLFLILNRLHKVIREKKPMATVVMLLEELVAYTRFHFESEEQDMERLGYPEWEKHRQEHAELTIQVLAFQREFLSRNQPPETDLLVFLQGWVINHIQGSDGRYAEFFQKNGQSLKPIASRPRAENLVP